MNTRVSLAATRRAWESTASISGLRVTMPARQAVSSSSGPSSIPPRARAFSIWARSCWLSKGLVRKLNTPLLVASMASGIVPWAVRMMTGRVGCFLLMAWNRAMPSIPGMRKSVITRWGRNTETSTRAFSALSATATS